MSHAGTCWSQLRSAVATAADVSLVARAPLPVRLARITPQCHKAWTLFAGGATNTPAQVKTARFADNFQPCTTPGADLDAAPLSGIPHTKMPDCASCGTVFLKATKSGHRMVATRRIACARAEVDKHSRSSGACCASVGLGFTEPRGRESGGDGRRPPPPWP